MQVTGAEHMSSTRSLGASCVKTCIIRSLLALIRMLMFSLVLDPDMAGIVGVLLNFASLWCVHTTSATTYAVVGSVNVVSRALVGALTRDYLFREGLT